MQKKIKFMRREKKKTKLKVIVNLDSARDNLNAPLFLIQNESRKCKNCMEKRNASEKNVDKQQSIVGKQSGIQYTRLASRPFKPTLSR